LLDTVRIWNAKSSKEVRKLERGSVNSVAFSPDGSRIAPGSPDGTIRIWDAKWGNDARKLEYHSGPDWSVAFSPDSSRNASGSDDGTA
jgi:WD40 repeat protein